MAINTLKDGAAGRTIVNFSNASGTINAKDVVKLDTDVLKVKKAPTTSAGVSSKTPILVDGPDRIDGSDTASEYSSSYGILVGTDTAGNRVFSKNLPAQFSSSNNRWFKLDANNNFVSSGIVSTVLRGVPKLNPVDGNYYIIRYVTTNTIQICLFDWDTMTYTNGTNIVLAINGYASYSNDADFDFTSNGHAILMHSVSSNSYYAIVDTDLSTVLTNSTILSSYTSSQVYGMIRTTSGHLAVHVYGNLSGEYQQLTLFSNNGTFISSHQSTINRSRGTSGNRNNINQSPTGAIYHFFEHQPDKVSLWHASSGTWGYMAYDFVGSSYTTNNSLVTGFYPSDKISIISHDSRLYFVGSSSTTTDGKITVVDPSTLTVNATKTFVGARNGDNAPSFIFQDGTTNTFVLGGVLSSTSKSAFFEQIELNGDNVNWVGYAVESTQYGYIRAVKYSDGKIDYLQGYDTYSTSFYDLITQSYIIATNTITPPTVLVDVTSTNIDAFNYSGQYSMIKDYSTFADLGSQFSYVGVSLVDNTGNTHLAKIDWVPNNSIILGVADQDSVGSSVNVIMEGWTSLSSPYASVFATVNDTASGGNSVNIYGAAAKVLGGV